MQSQFFEPVPPGQSVMLNLGAVMHFKLDLLSKSAPSESHQQPAAEGKQPCPKLSYTAQMQAMSGVQVTSYHGSNSILP